VKRAIQDGTPCWHSACQPPPNHSWADGASHPATVEPSPALTKNSPTQLCHSAALASTSPTQPSHPAQPQRRGDRSLRSLVFAAQTRPHLDKELVRVRLGQVLPQVVHRHAGRHLDVRGALHAPAARGGGAGHGVLHSHDKCVCICCSLTADKGIYACCMYACSTLQRGWRRRAGLHVPGLSCTSTTHPTTCVCAASFPGEGAV